MAGSAVELDCEFGGELVSLDGNSPGGAFVLSILDKALTVLEKDWVR